MSFYQELYLKCLELAHQEALEFKSSPLNKEEIVTSAKELYDQAITKAPKEPTYLLKGKTNNQPLVKEGYKICPGCGEEIPTAWKKHHYKKNGEKCGQEQ